MFLTLECAVTLAFQAKKPIEYVNALVGTAPLDDPKLIGNAPPPGEELYTGMTSPGAVMPHGVTNFGPINKNLDLANVAGVGMAYNYIHRTMLGFTSGMAGLTFMPVVGDWTVPPERTAAFYSKDKERATPGYYTVYFDDYNIKVEMTAGVLSGVYRFTFPKTDRARVLMDLGRSGGNLEVVGDRTVRGYGERGIRGQISGTSMSGTARTYFVAEFSRPFASFGTFHQNPIQAGSRGSILSGNSVTAGTRAESGSYAGAYLNFKMEGGEQVLVRVSSGDSYEAIEKILEAEGAN